MDLQVTLLCKWQDVWASLWFSLLLPAASNGFSIYYFLDNMTMSLRHSPTDCKVTIPPKLTGDKLNSHLFSMIASFKETSSQPTKLKSPSASWKVFSAFRLDQAPLIGPSSLFSREFQIELMSYLICQCLSVFVSKLIRVFPT